MSRLREMADREAARLEQEYEDGLLSNEELQQALHELNCEFHESAHEEAMEYYNDLIG